MHKMFSDPEFSCIMRVWHNKKEVEFIASARKPIFGSGATIEEALDNLYNSLHKPNTDEFWDNQPTPIRLHTGTKEVCVSCEG